MVRPIVLGLSLVTILGSQALWSAEKEGDAKPYGLDRRVPFVTSRVVGSPEPPLPFKTEPAFPNLKLKQVLSIEPEPGTDNLFMTLHVGSWNGGGEVRRVKNDPNVSESELLIAYPKELSYAVAVHPKYRENGYIYVFVSDKQEPVVHDRIWRYTVDRKPPFGIVPDSKTEIIAWPSNGHDGGGVHFGKDGYLYATAGDGSSDSDTYGAGQDLGNIPGSMIRIDVDKPDPGRNYSIPKDNPFLGFPGAAPEIYAYGLRNPWKLDIDDKSGQIWVGANGQDLWETVHLINKGDNHGWPIYEGSHPFHLDRPRGPTPPVKPAAEHHHSEARSLTGGVVYTGKKLPELTGAYIYGDYSTGRVWAIRHDGTKATFHKELVDTPFAISGFGNDPNGDLWVIDHPGGIHKIVPNDKKTADAGFPRKLSETGLFTDVKSHTLAAGIVPYAPAAPFWSDGAIKTRAIGVPGTQPIDTASSRWEAPDGTVTIKSFQLETKVGDPSSRKYIETRVMVREQKEWTGYTYVWNEAGTDAELVEKNGLDKTFRIEDRADPRGFRDQVWHYPSRTECMVCHSRAANFVLGFNHLQLDAEFDYGGGRKDNQLRTLYHVGLLKNDKGYQPRKPDDIHLVDPNDKSQPLESRARSFFYTNCASCHVDAGGGNSLMNMDIFAKRDDMKIVGVKPLHLFPDNPSAQLVKPGEPENSVVFLRMSRRGNGQMPPLGSNVVDSKSVELLREWIESLATEPKPSAKTD